MLALTILQAEFLLNVLVIQKILIEHLFCANIEHMIEWHHRHCKENDVL